MRSETLVLLDFLECFHAIRRYRSVPAGPGVENQWVAQWPVVRVLGTRKLGAVRMNRSKSFASESLCAFTLLEVLGTLLVAEQLRRAQWFVAVVAVSDRQEFEPCLCG